MFSFAKEVFRKPMITNASISYNVSELQNFITYLKNKHSVISEYFLDSKQNVKCLFFQDSFMKDVFNFYPERLCIDVTLKCIDVNIFLYLFLCEDSSGRSHVISLGFTYSDDSESLYWLFNTFKKHNPNWRRIKVIITDPEIKQREVIRTLFPHPYIVICFHHAFQSFKNGLRDVQMHVFIANDQIQLALDLFKSMYHSHSSTEFDIFYQQFILLHESIVSYFQEVWIYMQNQWRTGLDYFHENIFSSINYKLEEINTTYKSMFMNENNMQELLKKIFFLFSLHRDEENNILLNDSSHLYSRFSSEYLISKLLTPYAAKFVIDQLDLSSDIHMDFSVLSENYLFDNYGTPVNASSALCSCQFFQFTFLPCRHIFAVRKTLSLCIFDVALVHNCWTLKYFQSSFVPIFENVKKINSILPQKVVPNSVSILLESLFPMFLNLPDAAFDSAFQLANLWKNNKNVYLQVSRIERSESILTFDSQIDDISEKPEPSYNYHVKTSPVCKEEYLDSPDPEDIYIEKHTCIEESTSFQATIHNKWNFKSKVLSGNHINYTYLSRVVCETKDSCFNWLRKMKLIPNTMLCSSCGGEMIVKSAPRLSDGAVWVCPSSQENKKSCSRRSSVRRGSWFELTNMTFEQILTFCYMWINGFSQSQIISETGISTATYISWNKLNKRVCEEVLVEDDKQSNIKMDVSSKVLDVWIKNCKEDPFLKFLQDANSMHRKDTVKHSMH